MLSRDREFIVLYRGKDFLPAAVSSAIEERRKYELANKRKGTDKNLPGVGENEHEQQTSGQVCEYEKNRKDQKFELSSEERELKSTEAAVGRTSAKLSEACVFEDIVCPVTLPTRMSFINMNYCFTGACKESSCRENSS